MHPYLSQAIAAERRRDLAAEAARERLVVQAVPGHQGLVARAVERWRMAWARPVRAARGAACCMPTSAAC